VSVGPPPPDRVIPKSPQQAGILAASANQGGVEMRRLALATVATLFAAALSVQGASAAASTRVATGDPLHFLTVDVPGATTTEVSAVNNAGVLVGSYEGKAGIAHGFLKKNGKFTSFDPPGSTGTFPSGINDWGVTVGTYIDSSGNSHGFVRTAHGAYTILNDPNAPPGTTNGESLNDAGVIIGYYLDTHAAIHGFVLRDGHYAKLDEPDAGSGADQGTLLNGINSAGVITGEYVENNGVARGFVYTAGEFITFSAPGAGTADGQGTAPYGIAANGLVTGWTLDHKDAFHGWILLGWTFTSLNDPKAGSGKYEGTITFGVSQNGGTVVGQYFNHSGDHGFEVSITS
jgi:hypothetical protein